MAGILRNASRPPVESVTELVRRLRGILDSELGQVWVGGEISNLRIPASGHVYFCLKDERSQIAAVMFRGPARLLPFRPADGLQVIARGRLSVYDARGDLQLYVDAMEPRGLGSALLAFEQLKQRLAAEGLFADERKRPLPFWPRAVGVVTALGGAAVHDIVSTLRRRMPCVRVVVRPVRVQGPPAGPEIASAIGELAGVSGVEVLIVGRGGGSVEDLWAFNEERVARAIADSRVPVISAVGHQIDVTLADLVADRRAATPTAAAALAVPDVEELARRVETARLSLGGAWRSLLALNRERLDVTRRRLRDPRQMLAAQRLRIDDLHERARRSVESLTRLARERVYGASERLNALSPLAVLERGYAIVQRDGDARVLRSVADLAPHDSIRVRLARGRFLARVERLED